MAFPGYSRAEGKSGTEYFQGEEHMSITFYEDTRVFSLQTKSSTWQMMVSKYGHLLHLYYGNKIPEGELSYLIRGINRGFSGAPYEAGEDRGILWTPILRNILPLGWEITGKAVCMWSTRTAARRWN